MIILYFQYISSPLHLGNIKIKPVSPKLQTSLLPQISAPPDDFQTDSSDFAQSISFQKLFDFSVEN